MFMSGHRSNKSFKTHNRHMLDEHKLSVSSCLSNVTNPYQNNQPSVQFIHIITRHNTSLFCLSVFPQEEVELHSKKKPPITLHAVAWSAPICHQKFSPSPSSITVFSNYRNTLTERLMFQVDLHRFYWDDVNTFCKFPLNVKSYFSQNMVNLIYNVD